MYLQVILAGLLAFAAACELPEHMKRALPTKTVIKNVHIFDGNQFSAKTSSIVIVGGMISNAPALGATNIVDGAGGYLIPGLIDSHCHVTSCAYLTTMRQYGITTALDMGTYPYSAISSCKGHGVTDIRGSGAAATVNGTAISKIPATPSLLRTVSRKAQIISKFSSTPLGPDPTTVAAIVEAAHEAGKRVISHATTYADYSVAEGAEVDIPCHVPLDAPINASSIASLISNKSTVVPTLIMMQSIVNNTGAPPIVYTSAAEASVSNMHNGGVPILVGTDANTSPFVPANPPFGSSIHDELELLVAAGLPPAQAIQGATSLAATKFGLYDRGAIKAGFRADLALLSADPTTNIKNSRSIQKVWVDGVEADIA
ncbi:hypothetical protein N7450_005484 [Penicillium hetheringtonii]|uniref:Amidohydrolase-related domain-containing protein n=1 Tax=Penicillium hetheringtonii TaxID=911720 RepID=A0AAD6GSD6_9EURO|nr:hypothetical protein N7450_005484 [Penicillium hetheringtonii]